MAKSRLDRVIKVLLTICTILYIYLFSIGILWYRKTDVPYTIDGYSNRENVARQLYDELYKPRVKMSNEYYRALIENDLRFYFYLYAEADFKDRNGICMGSIRLIVVDSNLSGYRYCVTLAHEMMHLRKFRKQENYICFETFKYLYESDVMHNVGVWYAIKQLEGAYSGEYNISNQIVDYLTNK